MKIVLLFVLFVVALALADDGPPGINSIDFVGNPEADAPPSDMSPFVGNPEAGAPPSDMSLFVGNPEADAPPSDMSPFGNPEADAPPRDMSGFAQIEENETRKKSDINIRIIKRLRKKLLKCQKEKEEANTKETDSKDCKSLTSDGCYKKSVMELCPQMCAEDHEQRLVDRKIRNTFGSSLYETAINLKYCDDQFTGSDDQLAAKLAHCIQNLEFLAKLKSLEDTHCPLDCDKEACKLEYEYDESIEDHLVSASCECDYGYVLEEGKCSAACDLKICSGDSEKCEIVFTTCATISSLTACDLKICSGDSEKCDVINGEATCVDES